MFIRHQGGKINGSKSNAKKIKKFINYRYSCYFFNYGNYLWNNFKSNWIIEEEEYIDAHGFKAKRPKKKIPLRNTEKALKNQANFEGGDALSKASQYAPFGRMFL